MATEVSRVPTVYNDPAPLSSLHNVERNGAAGEEKQTEVAQVAADPQTSQIAQSNGQQAATTPIHHLDVTPDSSNVAHLPADAAIDDIRVEGTNLVLVQADGTEITIVNGALNIPTFLLGEVALPQQAVIAALEQSGVNVAAGADGSYQATSAAQGSHGGFQDTGAEGLASLGPLAELLSNTDQADASLLGANQTFNGVPLIQPNETGIFSELGTDGGLFERGSLTGVFGFDAGKDLGVITGIAFKDALNVDEATAGGTTLALTSGGEPVVIITSGLTITGTVGGQPVFTLTVDKVTGAFTYAQFLPLDHPDKGESGPDDVIRLQFTYTVTDKNGDAVTGQASIDIRDDAPTARTLDAATALSDAAQLSEGSSEAASSTASGGAGSLFHAGADGVKSISFTVPEGLKAITSNEAGVVVQETMRYTTTTDTSGHTILTALGTTSDHVIFTLTVAADGSYVFDASASLVHNAAAGTGDILPVSIGYTVTDGDGDTATGALTVNVQDDVPSANDVTSTMSENETGSVVLSAGTDYAFGADRGSISFGGSWVSDGPPGVKLGTPEIVIGKDGHSVSIIAGTAFDALAIGETAVIHIPYTVRDGDGDTVTKDIAITIKGTNDTPVAVAQSGAVAEDAVKSDVAGNFLAGASDVDDGARLSVSSVAGQTNGKGGIDGTYGHLTWDAATGAYSYQLDNAKASVQSLAAGETVKETFSFTVTDEHNATSTQTLTIVVQGANDAPTLTGDLSASVQKGQGYTLTTADLYFTDPDDKSATFKVSNLVHGIIYVNGVASTSFSAEQLAAGQVSFLQDGSNEKTASFQVVVEDGDEDHSTPVAGTFHVSVTGTEQPPVIERWTVITNATEGDTISIPNAALLWTAFDPNGHTLAITAVSGKDATLVNGAVDFKISAGSGSFDYTVTDGTLHSTATATVGHHWDTTGTASNEIFIAYQSGNGFTVTGGLGNDVLIGSANTAHNILYGDGLTETKNDGSDLLIGGVNSSNLMYGGGGNDILIAATHAYNHMDGGSGNDTLIGADSASNDMFGGSDNDTLIGGNFATNTMDGGNGNDVFEGGIFSVNNMAGGTGDDTFRLIQSSFNTVAGGDGKDILDFSRFDHGIEIVLTQSDSLTHFDIAGGGLDYSGIEGIVGTHFNDLITGSDYADILIGGGGDDILIGGGGSDLLYGGAGMNTMTGGTGADTFFIDEAALNKLDPADVITDFNPKSEGDQVDVSGLINALINQSGLSADDALGKLSAVVNDKTSETTISINTGSETHAIVTLQNYAPGSEAIKILFDHSEHAITTTHTAGG